MTVSEKLKMYREKKQFIYEIARTFIKVPSGHSIEDVKYEVFFRETESRTEIEEWITVQYKGGAEAHRMAHGNSNAANFQQVAKMLDGGCYEYNGWYDRLAECGFKKLDLYQMYSFKEVK